MNLFLVILFIILIVVVIYLYQYRPTVTTNIKELYAEGLDLLVSGKRQAAYKNFKEIVDKDSNNIMHNLGKFYYLSATQLLYAFKFYANS